jgi:hypothetical protein
MGKIIAFICIYRVENKLNDLYIDNLHLKDMIRCFLKLKFNFI